MFRHILVPADLSEHNRAALDVAAGLAHCPPPPGDPAGPGCRLTLLHVVETIDHVPFEELRDFYRRLEEKARIGLEELAAAAPEGAPPRETRVVFGKRAQAILEVAVEAGCDLIVLTSRPVDPQHPASTWATISHKVALLASCPVLLVR